MPEDSADTKTDQIGTQNKKIALSSQQVENKKLKERLAYVAADNYVKKNEINNLKLDFWKQQENYVDLRVASIKEKSEIRQKLEHEVSNNILLMRQIQVDIPNMDLKS